MAIYTNGIKQVNTPAFEAYRSGDQSGIADSTSTKLNFNAEIFDTDGTYDSSTNYRFTPAVAGKYFVYGRVIFNDTNVSGNSDRHNVYIYKNGGRISHFFVAPEHNDPIITYHEVVDLNTTDYIEIYVSISNSDGARVVHGNNATTKFTTFGAYRILT
jgi:hypothetical protein